MPSRLTVFLHLIAALVGTLAVSDAATPRVNEYLTLPISGNEALGFGESVSLSGDTVLVGNSRFGELRRFDRATGVEDKSFAHQFGSNSDSRLALSIRQNVVAVGAAASTRYSGIFNGSAHLIDLTTGEETHRVSLSVFENRPTFGSAVAISDRVLLVGEDGINSPFSREGSAHVFDLETGEKLYKLTIDEDDAFLGASFGTAVAIEDDTLLVAASSDTVAGQRNAGSVRIYDVATGTELRTLTPGGSWSEYFGRSLDVDDGTVVVGATGADGVVRDSGAVYLFELSTGDQIAKLTPSDGIRRGYFGRSVAIDEGLVLVGAPFDNENGEFTGAAYLFDAETGKELAKLVPSEPVPYEEFGGAVAIDNGYAVIGATADFSLGSAYLFDLTRFIPEPSSAALATLAGLAVFPRRANPTKPACVP